MIQQGAFETVVLFSRPKRLFQLLPIFILLSLESSTLIFQLISYQFTVKFIANNYFLTFLFLIIILRADDYGENYCSLWKHFWKH